MYSVKNNFHRSFRGLHKQGSRDKRINCQEQKHYRDQGADHWSFLTSPVLTGKPLYPQQN